ncbi:hypothetical protein LDENG_00177930 [Lucifuga dentata]|nr:hypothetical protein LDENG_00177930 [Lucifuga dentata]
MEVWKVGKIFLIHLSSSMLWGMIVSNVTCMKIEYIRLKHAKWLAWSFNSMHYVWSFKTSLSTSLTAQSRLAASIPIVLRLQSSCHAYVHMCLCIHVSACPACLFVCRS